MVLNLTLSAEEGRMLPFNYQYAVCSMIYRVLAKANEGYATYLHEKGYNYKNKLFTFSDLEVEFTHNGDRMFLMSKSAILRICFHVKEAANYFLTGLFKDQFIDIADKKSRVRFHVVDVKCEYPDVLYALPGDHVSVIFQPLSPVVGGYRVEGKMKDFHPSDPQFLQTIIYKWLFRYKAVYGIDDFTLLHLENELKVKPFWYKAPKERLLRIKEGGRAMGYTGILFEVSATKKLIELALDTGIGALNTQGAGCVKICKYL